MKAFKQKVEKEKIECEAAIRIDTENQAQEHSQKAIKERDDKITKI